MKLNFAGILFAALSLFALETVAAPVTSTQASSAASAFAKRGGTLGVYLGASVEKCAEQATSNGARFFTVKMRGGGTVITTGDTDLEPIIAFLPGSEDLSTIDKASPLWALLDGNLSACKAALVAKESASLAAQSVARLSESAAANQQKWAELVEEGEALSSRVLDGASSIMTFSSLGDLRVPVLVKTKWDQSGHGENLFTPNNYVCGCVATAMSQLMRYHCWPKIEVLPFTRTCEVDGVSTRETARGGVYDWANMPLNGGASQVEKEAVGTLTYDCGVSVGMSWSAEGSGAVTSDVADSLRRYFGYASALAAVDYDGLGMDDRSLGAILYSSLDAGAPVQLGINQDGYNGHSILGDGYGFVNKVSYIHLNMGWSGMGDAWYHFPDIDYVATAGGSEYHANTVHTCVFNVFPDKEGYVLSGRAVSDDEAMADVIVRVFEGATLVAQTNTNERGIYAFILPENRTYRVTAEAPDGRLGELSGISMNEYDGNSWGNDFDLTTPKVRVRNTAGGEWEYFLSLDYALLSAAENNYEHTTIEILEPAKFTSAAWNINFDCTICATSSVPRTTPIRRLSGGTLNIRDGARVLLENVVFTDYGTVPAVNVGADSVVAMSGIVGLRRFHLEEGGRIELAGALDPENTYADSYCGYLVDQDGPSAKGDAFGFATCDQATAATYAALFTNDRDDDLGGFAVGAGSGVQLCWDIAPLDDSVAAVKLIQDGDETNFRALDSVFKYVTNGAEIVVLQKEGCTMTNMVNVTKDLLFTSRFGATIRPLSGSRGLEGFTISDGGSLVMSNVTFTGFTTGYAFVTLDDGDFTMENGTHFNAIESGGINAGAAGAIKWGPVYVKTGTMTMKEGSVIENCTTGSEIASGGAVTLLGAGAVLDLAGGTITNCHATTAGGAVCSYKGSQVQVSGNSVVRGNHVGVNRTRDNIVLVGADNLISVTAAVQDGEIGVRSSSALKNAEGVAFASIDASLGEHELATTAECFSNDASTSLYADVDETGSKLVWSETPFEHRPLEESEWGGDDDFVRVVSPSGEETHWSAFEWAMEAVTEDGTSVELMKDGGFFAEDVVCSNEVTLTSKAGVYALTRYGQHGITVTETGKLTLGNVILQGDNDPTLRSIGLLFVNGGSLTLNAGTELRYVYGSGSRSAGAVTVWNEGAFEMNAGALIHDCENDFVNEALKTGHGAGVSVIAGSAVFKGGTVTACRAYNAAGVFIGDQATLEIEGEVKIDDNFTLEGAPSNLFVADQSALVATGPIEDTVAYSEGVGADTNCFGVVLATVDAGVLADIAGSAYRYVHDLDGDFGVVVTNETEALLVWNKAVVEGVYEDEEGNVYGEYEASGTRHVAVPVPFANLEYDGTEKTGFTLRAGLVYENVTATDAGTYMATVSLEDGYAWPNDTTAAQQIEWTIAKRTLTVTADNLLKTEGDDDPEFTYVATGAVADETPAFTGALTREAGETAGTYAILYDGSTLALADNTPFKATNYEIEFVSGTLTIAAKEPDPEPETITCIPFAFTAIEGQEGDWTLALEPGVPGCSYTLRTSDDLTSWTAVSVKTLSEGDITTPGSNFTFTVRSGDVKRFWMVVGEDGTKTK